MNIDWFTLVAQIVNFLILVGLLWYFLFRRIIRAMDERERKIAARFEDADKKQALAEKEANRLREQQRELHREREDLMQQARQEVQEEKERMLEKARAEVDRLSEQWRKSLAQQKETLIAILRERSAQLVLDLTKRTVSDLMDVDARKRMVDAFINKMRESERSELSSIIDAARSADNTATLAAGFELSEDDKERIQNAIAETLDKRLTIRFDSPADHVTGVELRADGRRIAWTIERYLGGLEERIAEAFAGAGIRESHGGKQHEEKA